MAVNETIVTGRKFRKLVDEANKLWQRISFWTKASDVEFDDGQTAENKMGAISGITSDINGESENIAASIKVVNQLNSSLCSLASPFWSDYKNNETDVTSYVLNGYTVPYNCKIIYYITGAAASAGGYPTVDVRLNGTVCKSYRAELQNEALWYDTMLLKKGDVIKIITDRSTLSYAKMYSL